MSEKLFRLVSDGVMQHYIPDPQATLNAALGAKVRGWVNTGGQPWTPIALQHEAMLLEMTPNVDCWSRKDIIALLRAIADALSEEGNHPGKPESEEGEHENQ